MIKLYYSPGTACLAPHFLLEEFKLPYELVLVDTSRQEHQREAYLKLNPLGKIPLLTDLTEEEFSLTESAAICLHLQDRFAASHAPAFHLEIGSAQRAQLYKWMLYLSNTLQAELISYFYPERLLAEAELAQKVKESAENRVATMLSYIEQHFAQTKGPYLLGDTVSIADFYLFMLGRWTRGMQKPARAYPHLGVFMQRMFERPSIVTSFSQEGLQAPYF
ncbi:glutathione S-transferase family protein [Undibacterium cyanobacteriorum]|uniref:Glutathione S-transferase family protein n=1 Tax=Undibacterium cyanobacteriorum TaxID=3073561 RepID=A0ABY9RIF0_9BURK|nr:glutathione S-transferase family protein [Undibacterium sp. 20NA77.5]WMW79871.1 glutathione S-transferase family protein [Undibacterium sp. 20NA77.5]